MKRTYDTVAALSMLISGLYIAWFTYAFDQMTRPMIGPPPWSYWSLFVAGGALSASAVALFRWRRPAAIVGSLTSLALAVLFIPTQFPNFRMPSEYGASIGLFLVGALVFLRFAKPSSCGSAVT